jgi:ectoine hydroxylase-related dioxygenase (phytanoyl-CoA dioxygenase family)
MPKFLSPEQVEQFKREGYTAPFRAVSGAQAREFRRRIEGIEEKLGHDSEGYFKIKAHIAAPWMVDLACHAKILDAVEDLIGPNILLLGSSLFAKQAHDPRFVSWHQDSAYFGLTPHEEVTVWVAFTESNESNGCVRVMPRTHTGADLQHVEKIEPTNMLSRGQTIVGLDESKAISLVLHPGEFSLHHERTAHSSHANNSDDRRIGLAFFYIPTHIQSQKIRRGALLVRGTDCFHHWNDDPLPRYDLDPICIAELDRVWGQYRKGLYKAH